MTGRILKPFVMALGFALGLTVLSDAQGPVVLRNSSGTEIATSATPVRVDPTGSTTQPVSGTVTANQGGTWTVQPGNTANTTAWKVDGSAVTQPVSAASLPLPTGASTAAKQPALGTAGSASTDVLTVQGIASMTALKVDGSGVTQPVSGTVSITANSAVNVAQLAGTTTDTNSGNKSAGTLRVVLATDQPALTNKLLVTPDSVALPANQSVNVSQINGVTPLMGAGNTGTGSHRVTIATDQAALAGMGVGATGAAPPANANYIAGVGSGATGGFLVTPTACDSQAFLDMTTATTTELVALTASRKVYLCYWLAIANGATTMTFKRGTGTNCGTGTTTISNAWELTAQTGFSGGSGLGAIFDNQNAGDALCVTSSAAVNLHVFVRYAKY